MWRLEHFSKGYYKPKNVIANFLILAYNINTETYVFWLASVLVKVWLTLQSEILVS